MSGKQQVIIDFLTSVGFKELGVNQYIHDRFGLIFLKDYEPEAVFNTIMCLGASHRVNQIRQLLEVDSEFTFRATASEGISKL